MIPQAWLFELSGSAARRELSRTFELSHKAARRELKRPMMRRGLN